MGCLKFGHRSSGSQANTPLGKEKLVRTFSVLSCGTFRHEDSHSPSECVGECTHAWEGIGPLPPSHFAMMSLADIVAIANRHTVIAAS